MKYVIAYYLVALALLNWPMIQFANRVEPVVCGIPFFLFYCYAVAVLALIGNIYIGLKVIRDPAHEVVSEDDPQ